MRSVTVRLEDLKTMIMNLGHAGENEHTRVTVDCRKMFEQYPAASASLTVQPPEGEAYPAVIERDGDFVIWDVTDSDLISVGHGEMQLSFTQEPHLAKSYVGRFRVGRSIIPTGDVPEPLDDFLTRAGAALTGIPETINSALAAAKASGEFNGPQGPAGQDGAPGQDGVDGVTPEISIGTVAKGTDPAASMDNTDPAHPVLSLTLPKGDKGDTGNAAPAEQVVPAVNAYLASAITNPDSPPLDRTLSAAQAAAPADMVGDLKSAIGNVLDMSIAEKNVGTVILDGSTSAGASWSSPTLTVPSGSTGLGSNIYAKVSIPYEYSNVTELLCVIEYTCTDAIKKNIGEKLFNTTADEVLELTENRCVIRLTPNLTKTYVAAGITVNKDETYASEQTITVTKYGLYAFESDNFLNYLITTQGQTFSDTISRNAIALKNNFSKITDIEWKRGGYSYSTGNYSDHSKRICSTGYISTSITRIVTTNGFNLAVLVYDSSNNDEYVGVWVDSTNTTATSSYVFYTDVCLASIYAANISYRVKLMATDYNTEIDASYGRNILCMSAENIINSIGRNKLFSFGDSYTMMQRWQKYVVSYCGLTFYTLNALIGGTCVERFGYITNCPADADVVTVWYGTNDWGANVQIGDMDDAVATQGTTASTFFSAMKYIMEWLATNRPTARVFLLTHTQRFDSSAMSLGEANGYDGEFPKNNNGKTLKDFADAIKTVGQQYGYPVIDLQSYAGINKDTYSQYYDSDKLHPSYNGGKYLGKLIAKQINLLA